MAHLTTEPTVTSLKAYRLSDVCLAKSVSAPVLPKPSTSFAPEFQRQFETWTEKGI
ncbi:hypothetical protein [Roseovarius confluentis]|uniref:hypothetical protein n=1 Tax=Roseovarius confluentis TaxID=1852027 RepID=UPI003C7D6285